MIINPHKAIEQGWIKGIKNETLQVQPNAIDFTIDRVFGINSHNTFVICNDPENPNKELKQMRGGGEMVPAEDRRTGVPFFNLLAHTSYDILSDVYVDLPDGVAALTIIRSSFCRNGLFVTSGLYDSGFKGHVGCVLHNIVGDTKVQQGVRVGQIILIEASSAKLYAGGWNHELGTEAPHQ